MSTPSVCPGCGERVDGDEPFCINCGRSLGAAEGPTGVAIVQPDEPWTEATDPVVAGFADVLDHGRDGTAGIDGGTVALAVDRLSAVAGSMVLPDIPGAVVDAADGLVRALSLFAPERLTDHTTALLGALDPAPSSGPPDLQYCEDCHRTFTTTAADRDRCGSCDAELRVVTGETTIAGARCWCGGSGAACACGGTVWGASAADYRGSIGGHLANLAAADGTVGERLADRLGTAPDEQSGALLGAIAVVAARAPTTVRPAAPALRSAASADATERGKAARIALLSLAAGTDDPAAVVGDGSVASDRVLAGADSPLDRAFGLAAAGVAPSEAGIRTHLADDRHLAADALVSARLVDVLYDDGGLAGTDTLPAIAETVPGLVGPVVPSLLDIDGLDDRSLVETLRQVAAHDPAAVRPARDRLLERLDAVPGDSDAFVALSHLSTVVEDPESFAGPVAAFVAQFPERTRLAEGEGSRPARRGLSRFLAALSEGDPAADGIAAGLVDMASDGGDESVSEATPLVELE
jgi:hypothetical protein